MTLKLRFVHIFGAASEDQGCRLRGDLRPESPGQNRVQGMRGDGKPIDYLHPRLSNADPQRQLQSRRMTPDLGMPRQGARQAPEAIKASNRLPCIPRVMLATSGEPQDIQCSDEGGIHAFISNPISFFGLPEVAKHLGRDWLALSGPLPRPAAHE